MVFRKINSETGIFIEDTLEVDLLEDGSQNNQCSYVEEPIPDTIYAEKDVSPKWTGTEWVATAEPPEVEPAQPSIEERLELAERVLLEMMLGGE